MNATPTLPVFLALPRLRKRGYAWRSSIANHCRRRVVLSTLVVLVALSALRTAYPSFVAPSRTGVAGGAAKDVEPSDNSGTRPGAMSVNLAKNIVGGGVLSLPAGAGEIVKASEAAGADHTAVTMVLLALSIGFGTLSAFGFYLVGEVCARTGATSYREAWRRTIGEQYSWVPALGSLICCLTGAVACLSVLGDTGIDMAAGSSFAFISRDQLLVGVATTMLFPMCLLPSLAPLAFASALGMLGVGLLVAVMVARCIDGSYAPGGDLFEAAPYTHVPVSAIQDPGAHASAFGLVGPSLLFVAMLSNAFSAHYNAPLMFQELAPTKGGASAAGYSSPSSKLEPFRNVVASAFALSCVLFTAVTLSGLDTFGAGLQPMVLSNYAQIDPLAGVARLGLGLCVLFEFPLLERCLRSTVVELLGLPQSTVHHPLAAICSVATVLALACIPGLGFDKLTAIGGALGASTLTYVAPALMALKLRERDSATTPDRSTPEAGVAAYADAGATWLARFSHGAEVGVLRGVAAMGATLGGLGVAEAAGLGV